MPRKVELNAAALLRKVAAMRRAGKSGTVSVGDPPGLLLQIRAPRPDKWKEPAGSAIWIYRYTNGTREGKDGSAVQRRVDLSLGAFGPTIDLTEARKRAHQQRALLLSGTDPKQKREKATAARLIEARGAATFRKVALSYIAEQDRNGRWKKRTKTTNKGSAHQWEQTLTDYAFPKIGNLRIGDVTRAHVLEVLEPIWTTKRETAKRLQNRIEKILDWATVKDLRKGENPARWRGYLDQILPIRGRADHFARVPVARFAEFMTDLRQRPGVSPLALEWCILTMSRPGETVLMRRKEIDVAAGVWTIPPGRDNEGLKSEAGRRVALSNAALDVLKRVPRFDKLALDAPVFPGARKATLSNDTLRAVIRRMHADALKAKRKGYADPAQGDAIATAHGIARSTTRDILTECGHFEDWLLEKCLGHSDDNKTRRAYQRGDVLAKQRAVMMKLAELAASRG